jgi:hypothetical protein
LLDSEFIQTLSKVQQLEKEIKASDWEKAYISLKKIGDGK